jgi:hypothetical protein
LFIRIVKYEVSQKLRNGDEITWTSEAGILFVLQVYQLSPASYATVDITRKADKKTSQGVQIIKLPFQMLRSVTLHPLIYRFAPKIKLH